MSAFSGVKTFPAMLNNCSTVIRAHHDLRKIFITLVRNDQQSFYLHHFHIIVLRVLFVYVKFRFIIEYNHVLTLNYTLYYI